MLAQLALLGKIGMLDQKQFISAIAQIAEEKGIPKDKVIEVIEMALAAAYKKDYGKRGQMIRVELDEKTGNMKFFQLKIVVDESVLAEVETEDDKEKLPEDKEAKVIDNQVNESKEKKSSPEESLEDKKIRFNPEKHIIMKEAKEILKKGEGRLVKRAEEMGEEEDKIKALKEAERYGGKEAAKKIKLFDYIETSIESHDVYGRIAAQTAKQVIMQRIREAEREVIFHEFMSKEGEVVSGVIQRMERGNIFIDIGKTTGVMFFNEQIPHEHYGIGQRIRVYIVKVERDAKGSLVILSRSHPKLVVKLFEFEVPEIEAGSVEIKAISREAGSRSKIAVVSNTEGVDPVGSCVGQKGTRVATIINELGGEKIDIIEWDEDQAEFIANALSPAKVLDVKLSKNKREARVEVDEDQLSLAIGKRGQNVRLAAKLTGWKIDIIAGKKKVEIKDSEDKEIKEDKEGGKALKEEKPQGVKKKAKKKEDKKSVVRKKKDVEKSEQENK